MKTFLNNIQPIWNKHKPIFIVLITIIIVSCILCILMPASRAPVEESETNSSTTANSDEPSAPETTANSDEPSEPVSIYSSYSTLFGEDSLSTALVGKRYQDFSEYDKQVLQDVVTRAGGEIIIDTTCVTLIGEDGQKALYYPDSTRIIVDAEGRASGTRWIDTELSGILPQPSMEVFQCIATDAVFAVKYTTEDASIFAEYCDELKLHGFTEKSFKSDVLFSAEHKDGYEVSVSYRHNLLIIMLNPISAETT